MVARQDTFDDMDAQFVACLDDNLANAGPHRTLQDFVAVFCCPHNVVPVVKSPVRGFGITHDLLRVGRPEIAVLRPRELTTAIDAVLVDNRFGLIVDAERIGAFGFSLGGSQFLPLPGGASNTRKSPGIVRTQRMTPNFALAKTVACLCQCGYEHGVWYIQSPK